MTKEEFIVGQQKMTRGMNQRMGFWMLFFFGSLLGCIPLSSYIERHEQEYLRNGTVFAVALGIFLFGNLAWMVWVGTRQQKRFGHRCPKCGKNLVGIHVPLAVATGNCGHCGAVVFFEAN